MESIVIQSTIAYALMPAFVVAELLVFIEDCNNRADDYLLALNDPNITPVGTYQNKVDRLENLITSCRTTEDIITSLHQQGNHHITSHPYVGAGNEAREIIN